MRELGRSGAVRFALVGLVLSVWTGCGGRRTVASNDAPAFAYTGDIGPGFWDELAPQWHSCSSDTRQSPIDISDPTVDATLEPLALDVYGTPLKLVNNGHTIEQEYETGSTLTFGGVTYDLQQFHFHTLSEHAIDGVRGVMELHAVFRNAASGALAVIGMLYQIGEPNEFLARFDERLPVKNGDHVEDHDTEIDLADGLTNTAAYYTYPGSLTTPPCSPIVTWIVLKERAELSPEQFRAFRNILGNDFRPLQERNGRTIRTTP